MKYVQIGILAALVGVGALLFMVWRGQQPQPIAAAPAVQAPVEQPAVVAQAPPPEARPVKPSPTVRPKRAARVEEPVAAQPVEIAVSAPAPAPAPEPLAAPPAPVEAPAPPPPPPQPRTVTLAAGTLLSVRLAETLSTDKVKAGDAFTATLDRPLVVDGLVIAERGTRLEGRVLEAQEAGRVKGVSSLSIHLVRLNTRDGQRVNIQTDPFHRQGETSKGEDVAKVGAGAGVGAIIGAIAGGGKGAGIGAAVGGAAGAGTVAATRGKAAVLPVETRLDFRLSSPLSLTEQK
jgi:hypothetical protein